MDIELKSKIDTFNDTFEVMRKDLMLDGRRLNEVGSLLSLTNYREFDIDKVKEIRKNLTITRFDLYKWRYKKFLSLFFCGSKDFEKLYKSSRNLYEHLANKGFGRNKKTLAAAIMLSKHFKGEKLDAMVEKVNALRERIIPKYYIYTILLALNNKDVNEVERDYKNIKKEIQKLHTYNENMTKLISLSLVSGNKEIKDKIENVLSLICNIKGEIGELSEESLFFIGMASLVVEDSEAFAKELNNVYTSFNSNKVMNRISNNKRKLIISIILLINKYIEEAEADIIDSSVNKEYLNIIQDYVICLMYFI